MSSQFNILVINTGSTSTKVALFKDMISIAFKEYRHSSEKLVLQRKIEDEIEYRWNFVAKFLEGLGARPDVVAARGGRLFPTPSGVFPVNSKMKQDALAGIQGHHASNLACLLGDRAGQLLAIPIYVVNPVAVDEFWPQSRLTGLPELRRHSLSHALNMKMVARKAAKAIGKQYRDSRLIVIHLGGGGSISAHSGGKMVDLFNSDEEGPMAIERAGGLPNIELIKLCYSGKYTLEEMLTRVSGEGGLYAHLGTKKFEEVLKFAESDFHSRQVLEVYLYQVCKYTGAMAAVLQFNLDAIALTGGVAKSTLVQQKLSEWLMPLAPVYFFPGEFEMEALAEGVADVLSGKVEPLTYLSNVPISSYEAKKEI